MATTTTVDETTDLLATLAKHQFLFRFTVRNLTDDQARLTPTVSALSLGGLVKHVTASQRDWTRFIVEGASAMSFTPESFVEHAATFRMEADDTRDELLADYSAAAARTEEVVRALPTLDVAQQLPEAPWFTDTHWSARRVLTHLIAETAQHAGHADIIRETIDGQKTMG